MPNHVGLFWKNKLKKFALHYTLQTVIDLCKFINYGAGAGPHTVEPLSGAHPWDWGKCLLNRGKENNIYFFISTSETAAVVIQAAR